VEDILWYIGKLADGIGLDGPSATPQIRAQLLAQFLANYTPADSIQRCSTRRTVFSWYYDLPYSLGRSNVLDTAVLALSLAFLGRRYCDTRLHDESRRLYDSVLTKIHRLSRAEGHSIIEDLIRTTMAMALYEV
jgi:hypothetical protein